MALSKLTPLTILPLLFYSSFVFIISTAEVENLTKSSLVLYFQDYSNGTNATLIPVAGIQGKLWTFTQFGTVYVTDDPITEAPEENSTSVGRAQGIYVTTDLDGANLLVILSVVFTNAQYNGSTIEIQGISKQFEGVRELSVVSGTGVFRFARGYATFGTYSFDLETGYTVIQANITVQHYSMLSTRVGDDSDRFSKFK